MGYTHYWRGWVTLSDSFITDVQAIIEQSGVTIAGWDGEGEPTLTNEEIRLNGSVVGDNDHETFLLINGVNRSTSFCKTAHKPYDIVVAAILLRAANLNKGFKVESDGNRKTMTGLPLVIFISWFFGSKRTVRKLSALHQ